ncbi:hypothetical protein KEM48_008343 [Puccinia striiformis f. sp. tritici PST-130]|nr:hypothetical protein KEM48_008343 [Puccinia striiformis f. sp. tritici PST-130]
MCAENGMLPDTFKLPEVVRMITEPYEATEIVRNVNKYFTEDAYLLYPMVNQPYTKQGKTKLIGLYKLLLSKTYYYGSCYHEKGYYSLVPDLGRAYRMLTINNQIEFHAVMFSEDKLKAAIGTYLICVPRSLGASSMNSRVCCRYLQRQMSVLTIVYNLELTETLQGRFIPIWFRLRFISRVDLRKEKDGKYRICKQEDNYPNDLKRAGLEIIPGLATFLDVCKFLLGLLAASIGNYYLENNLFGP